MIEADIMKCAPLSRFRGFTLLELLITLSVISVLVGLLMPAIGAIKASAYAANCKSNLRQCIMAHRVYANENKGWVPFTSYNNPQIPWFVTLADYLDRNNNGAGSYKNKATVSPVVQCAALRGRLDNLMNGTGMNNPGYGYCRNPFLYYGNSASGASGSSDYTNNNLPSGEFNWRSVTLQSNRLLVGDGWSEGTGTLEPTYWKQGATYGTMAYFYNHVWSTAWSNLQGAVGGSGVASPGRINTDLHRGMRSYGMCDGSVRSLTDDYTNAQNQAWLSVSNPAAL